MRQTRIVLRQSTHSPSKLQAIEHSTETKPVTFSVGIPEGLFATEKSQHHCCNETAEGHDKSYIAKGVEQHSSCHVPALCLHNFMLEGQNRIVQQQPGSQGMIDGPQE